MTEKQPADLPDMQPTHEVVQNTMQQFLEGADVGRVYGRPVRRGEVTIIPAAEVVTAMGFGVGVGVGQAEEAKESSGAAGGGGGGGKTFSRPVALVVVTADGVQIEPVFDPTKVALAAITAAGFMGGMLLRMLKARSKLRSTS